MNIQYIRSGDYFIPNLKLSKENRPIGKWGRMHRDYLKEYHPIQFNNLVLSGNLWTYLADLNEQVQQHMETMIAQMQSAEGMVELQKEGGIKYASLRLLRHRIVNDGCSESSCWRSRGTTVNLKPSEGTRSCPV